MKKTVYLIISSLVLLQCAEMPDWSNPKDTNPPKEISNPVVENLHGGVRITYTLPDDDDLLGIKALYSFNEIHEGELFSTGDTIEIHGFPNTLERVVRLISIDESFNESEAVEIKINPLTPPVELIRESLVVTPTFGGLFVSWQNIDRSDIGVTLLYDDGTNNMIENFTYFSNLSDGKYSFRGFDDIERRFTVEIRDRWGNTSEPLDTILKPYYEEEIVPYDPVTNSRRWRGYGVEDGTNYAVWMGDMTSWGSTFAGAIDGVTQSRGVWWQTPADRNRLSYWDTDIVPNSEEDKLVFPVQFTVDLGVASSLSRHVLWMRGRDIGEAMLLGTHRYYQQGAPKVYELWGLEEGKVPKQPMDFNMDKSASLRYWSEIEEFEGTGNWKNDWVYLGTNTCLPPSGASSTPMLTVDDIIYADEGFELEIDPQHSTKKFRYVRFVFYELYHAVPYVDIGEIKFYGAY